MHYSRYCRTILFVPALSQARYRKAQGQGADISLVDLEDSVSPHSKAEARAQAAAFFATSRVSGTRLAIRINSLSTPDGLADLLAIRSYPHKPDILMLPKVESPRDIELCDRILQPGPAHAEPLIELMAVIETARGLQAAAATALASPRLTALVFGSADMSRSLGATRSWESLYHARAEIVVAAHAAGIRAVDTACFDVTDQAHLVEETKRVRDMGFDGKAAIHPAQVAPINQVFSPDAAVLERARHIVAEAAAHGHNVCVVDGEMIGVPMVDAARRLLAEFDPAALPTGETDDDRHP